MKRTLTIAATAMALALVAVPLAQAARVNHVGKLVGVSDSEVKFKEATSGGGARNVVSFAVKHFELDCEGDAVGRVEFTKLRGDIEVSASGAFGVRDDNGKTVFKVKGQINRNKSFGSFRYFGEIKGSDGVARHCDSGKLAWVTRP